MINHVFLTAATVACQQARTSIPSTARPALRPTGHWMAGATVSPGKPVKRGGPAFGPGGRA